MPTRPDQRQASESPSERTRRPRWHLVYFALAAFELLTISASLYLNKHLTGLYSASVQRSEQWAGLLGEFSELGQMATAVNMPGNEVFDTGRVEEERAEQQEALARFNEELAMISGGLEQTLGAESASAIVVQLDQIRVSMDGMLDEAGAIFEAFERDDPAAAGARIASMDQRNADVGSAIAMVGGLVRNRQTEYFAEQEAIIARVVLLEFGIGGAVVVMVLLVTAYGHRLSHEMRRALDTTEQASRQAQAANEAKSAFLANMSHEIRTPMTAIIGFGELLIDPSAPEEDRKNAAQTISRNGRHLLALINDILDLSKIEAGRMDFEHSGTPVRRVVRDSVELVRPRCDESGIEIRVRAEGSYPDQIVTDAIRLRQCLVNLLSNAVKFSDGHDVELVVSGDRESIRFAVIDRGIGISADKIDRIFAPFNQADETMTRRFGGTGLGLSITRTLVEALGGSVSVESTVGEGSTFCFELLVGDLPAVQMVSTIAERSEAEARAEGFGEMPSLDGRVLLVEDGPDNQRLVSFLLKKAGAVVTVAENGKIGMDEALHALDLYEPYGVVLMDMQMPVMDGYTATRELRAAGYAGQIIALTAHAMAGEMERCLEAGCDHYLSKPIDRGMLIREVHARMGKMSDRADRSAA